MKGNVGDWRRENPEEKIITVDTLTWCLCLKVFYKSQARGRRSLRTEKQVTVENVLEVPIHPSTAIAQEGREQDD